MRHYWTGVGSREITDEEDDTMFNIAYHLALLGLIYRGGGAPGSDLSFEDGHMAAGVDYPKKVRRPEIFGPWKNWNNSTDPRRTLLYYSPDDIHAADLLGARELLKDVHPAFPYLKRGALALHSRNMHQPLGPRLDVPSMFLLACSDTDKYGIPKGGTRSAWVLAEQFGIPCFNIRNKSLYAIESFIGSITLTDIRV